MNFVSDFNPQSNDSMFSQILAEMREIRAKGDNRQEILNVIREQTIKTNGRVSALEATSETNRWWIVALSGVVLAITSVIALRH